MKALYMLIKHLGKGLLTVLLVFTFSETIAQEEEVHEITIHSRGLQRVGNTFESVWLIDNQTVHVPLKGTLEFDILHRFGTVQNGYKDFLGLYAPSNIRIGFGYTPTNNMMLGFGFSKDRLLWDLNLKYALLRESKGSPLSLTYFGNMAIDTREEKNFLNTSDRYSYFHQLMVARKITQDFSLQASANFSHFNMVEGFISFEEEIEGKMKNDHISASLMGRYKISDAFAFIANYDQPITQHKVNNPHPNISFGAELATPLHAFQIFMGNYRWMVPQYNQVLNQNDFRDGAFLIGFNITRLIDTKEENMVEMMFKRKQKNDQK